MPQKLRKLKTERLVSKPMFFSMGEIMRTLRLFKFEMRFRKQEINLSRINFLENTWIKRNTELKHKSAHAVSGAQIFVFIKCETCLYLYLSFTLSKIILIFVDTQG